MVSFPGVASTFQSTQNLSSHPSPAPPPPMNLNPHGNNWGNAAGCFENSKYSAQGNRNFDGRPRNNYRPVNPRGRRDNRNDSRNFRGQNSQNYQGQNSRNYQGQNFRNYQGQNSRNYQGQNFRSGFESRFTPRNQFPTPPYNRQNYGRSGSLGAGRGVANSMGNSQARFPNPLGFQNQPFRQERSAMPAVQDSIFCQLCSNPGHTVQLCPHLKEQGTDL